MSERTPILPLPHHPDPQKDSLAIIPHPKPWVNSDSLPFSHIPISRAFSRITHAALANHLNPQRIHSYPFPLLFVTHYLLCAPKPWVNSDSLPFSHIPISRAFSRMTHAALANYLNPQRIHSYPFPLLFVTCYLLCAPKPCVNSDSLSLSLL